MHTIPSRLGLLILLVAAILFGVVALLIQSGESGISPPPAKKGSQYRAAGIDAGVAPDNLEKLTDRKTITSIARRLKSGGSWRSPEDRTRAVRHFCTYANHEDIDLLYSLLRSEPTGEAYVAVIALTKLANHDLLRRMDRDLAAANPPEFRRRLLDVLAECQRPLARELSAKHAPGMLDPEDPALTRAALSAIKLHRIRSATKQIIALHNTTDDPDLDRLAMRALGVLWDTTLEDEELRLQAHLLVHMISMSEAATDDSCVALLRLMTRTELEKFLSDCSSESFSSRRFFVIAAGKHDMLDPKKGRLVHNAFLSSPDEKLVAYILLSSPHKLDMRKVGHLLSDERKIGLEDLPEDAVIAECAALRLSRDVDGSRDPFPTDPEARSRLPEKWRTWWEEQN